MTTQVSTVFERIPKTIPRRYISYWKKVAPKTDDDILRRWIFAFCSVHTTWEGNLRGYKALRDLGWEGDREELARRLKVCGTGLFNMRTRFIWDFATQFRADPTRFKKGNGDELWPESWAEYRDRLVALVNGLGMAKVSFAIEMMYPLEAEVLCLDVHMLRLYDMEKFNGSFTSRTSRKAYHNAERDWQERCKVKGIASYIVRSIWWDRNQNKTDSRYWSHCLEE